MPWKIFKRKGKYVVVKTSTGEVKSTFDLFRKAVAYLKALYAHEHS